MVAIIFSPTVFMYMYNQLFYISDTFGVVKTGQFAGLSVTGIIGKNNNIDNRVKC